ncbi:MAG: Hsp20/alpha crystallin family protein [Chloroflexota bacterium]
MTNYYVHPAHRMARRLARTAASEHNHVHIPVNVRFDGEAYLITAMVPGVSPADVKIEVLEDIVTLSGEFPVEQNEDTKSLLDELPSGQFSRRLRLPVTLDASGADAEIKNGMLSLRVLQAEESKAKQIKVKTK